MAKLISVICICLAALPVLAQPPARYQVATIMDVKAHQDGGSAVIRYDVSVQVGDAVYCVLYTPTSESITVKYAAGRQLLVLVEEKTIKYNDILGQSREVPILSQTPAVKPPKETGAH